MSVKENTKATPVEVGAKVDSKCGACKSLTKHIVISMEGEKPAQVRCNTCDRAHKYRPAPKAPSPKVKKNPHREEWLRLSANWDPQKAIAYKTSKSYKPNDIVNHSKFGLGQVTQLRDSAMMNVLFESGLKLMLCGK